MASLGAHTHCALGAMDALNPNEPHGAEATLSPDPSHLHAHSSHSIAVTPWMAGLFAGRMARSAWMCAPAAIMPCNTHTCMEVEEVA
eukprot:10361414-Lingulodinium_polyedra.AAC.1